MRCSSRYRPRPCARRSRTRPAWCAACPVSSATPTRRGTPRGRLKVRIGGHTITYRGALRIVERDGAITYEGEGAEVRGKGAAELSLTVVLTPVAEGTNLSFTGALSATGRLADETDGTRAATGARLLDRFVEALVGRRGALEGRAGAGAVAGPVRDAPDVPDVLGVPDVPDVPDGEGADRLDDDNRLDDNDGVDDGVEEPDARGSVFDAPVPPPPSTPSPTRASGTCRSSSPPRSPPPRPPTRAGP